MNTLKTFLDALLGVYTPVTYVIGNDNVIPAGLAGVDFPYVFRAIIFAIVLYAILRILGGMICKM